ncbi:MAG: response regulator [bacterium]|nr:response regulator [bacterium]
MTESKRKGSLNKRLMSYSLALALIPLVLVSLMIFSQSKKNLHDTTVERLVTATQASELFLNNWFSYRLIDLENQSRNQNNISFMEALLTSYSSSGMALPEFTKSHNWSVLADGPGTDLRAFVQEYGYYDAFLIDTHGGILFSVAEESDLGDNLFFGENKDSRFSKSCLLALQTGKATFSDLEVYGPSNDKISGFLTTVVLDGNGVLLGALALQFTDKHIEMAVHNKALENGGASTYLVGPSFSGNGITFRSRPDWSVNSKYNQNYLNTVVETEQTHLWSLTHEPGDSRSHLNNALNYRGPQGSKVLGLHSDIDVVGVHWGLITEIPTDVAFAQVIQLQRIVVLIVLSVGLLVALLTHFSIKQIVSPIVRLSEAARRVADGDLDQEIASKDKTELGQLTRSFNSMVFQLRENYLEQEAKIWLEENSTQLLSNLRGEHQFSVLGKSILNTLVKSLGFQVGAFYSVQNNNSLLLQGSYAMKFTDKTQIHFEPGEGMIGEVALKQKHLILKQVPDNYLTISSGLGGTLPTHLLIWPFIREGKTIGVLELGSLKPFSDAEISLLHNVSEGIGVALFSAQTFFNTQDMLESSQAQAEELHAQTEALTARETELQTTNINLSLQSKKLQKSEELLQQQSEELLTTNEQLEDRTINLARQKEEVEAAKALVEIHAKELAESSRYKSEFLANMSHELRTPLNSLLILSKSLSENSAGNLDENQVKAARIIHSGGSDLLNLINDILDLSKVEAGKLEANLGPMGIVALVSRLKEMFNRVAREKGLQFKIEVADDLPDVLITDGQKVEQVLRNLLSNAFKFTPSGEVILKISYSNGEKGSGGFSVSNNKMLAFAVVDTGLGIPPEKQKSIFESFQQADGSTNRTYGGTGLGLTISRRFSELLGGGVSVRSELGEGSVFTLLLPLGIEQNQKGHLAITDESNVPELPDEINNEEPGKDSGSSSQPGGSQEETLFLADDRCSLKPLGSTILIVEDDLNFAEILVSICHQKGFQCLVTPSGVQALQMVDNFKPDAVILDISLADLNGLSVLDEIKNNLYQRHIPVQIISGRDKKGAALQLGAIGYLEKPTSEGSIKIALDSISKKLDAPMLHLVVVEENGFKRDMIQKAVQFEGLKVTLLDNCKDVTRLLKNEEVNCLILGRDKNQLNGASLIEILDQEFDSLPACIVLDGGDFEDSDLEKMKLRGVCVLTLQPNALEALVDKTSLFLHSVEAILPENRKAKIEELHAKEDRLRGKKILIVDDDMRNVFALSSVLEAAGMLVSFAENGQICLDKLDQDGPVDLILMDVMMPVMDGHEASRKIRAKKGFSHIPIIALTARAMVADRTLCLEAGTNDYLAKPVDMEKLLSLVRLWTFNAECPV